jgi:hypothetical protein
VTGVYELAQLLANYGVLFFLLHKTKLIVLVLILSIIAITLSFARSKKEAAGAKAETGPTENETVAPKTETSAVKFNVKGLPEHSVSLIAPSDPILPGGRSVSVNPYSVVLRNNSSKAVVGYSIKWECFDGKRESPTRDMSHDRKFSNSLGFAFMYGEESERRAILNNADEVIEPNSTWLISPDFPARKINGRVEEISTGHDQATLAEVQAACPIMTVTLDGVFFDDGTFIGPDTNDFFAKVKTQMDVRHEVLRGVQSDLKSGKDSTEVFRGLEQIRDRERQVSGGEMTMNELRSFYRHMFAQDVLGMKEMWGADGAIANVQRQLSRPWVTLRKL